MTKRDFTTHFSNLVKADRIEIYLKTQSQKLIQSGAIDLNVYEKTEGGVAKMVLSVCLLSLADQHAPPRTSPYFKKYLELKHFREVF